MCAKSGAGDVYAKPISEIEAEESSQGDATQGQQTVSASDQAPEAAEPLAESGLTVHTDSESEGSDSDGVISTKPGAGNRQPSTLALLQKANQKYKEKNDGNQEASEDEEDIPPAPAAQAEVQDTEEVDSDAEISAPME